MLKYVGPAASGNKKKMTKAEIRDRFNTEVASVYRKQKTSFIPEYGFAFDLIAKTVAPYLGRNAEALDLGAGTGNLSKIVLESSRGGRVTLVDFSENMLKAVPRVLAGFEGRYSVMTADVFRLKLPAGRFDCVVSSLALHHGRRPAVYGALYRNIFRWLKNKGIFVCFDVVEGAAPAFSRLNEQGWREHLEKCLSAKDVARLFANYRREDSPISIPEHLRLLKQAGFRSADILWKKHNFCVYAAMK